MHSPLPPSLRMRNTSLSNPLPYIPDDVSLPEFMLYGAHPLRPDLSSRPCLIDDKSGRGVNIEEVGRLTLSD
jgi:hypothetical protein